MAYPKNLVTTAVIAALLLGVSGVAIAEKAGSSTKLDPQADALLKKMSDHMGGLKSFTVDIFISDEHIMGDGFKLSALRSGFIKARRPNKFFVSRKGMVRDQEIFFDGNGVVVHSKRIGMSIEVPVSGDAEAALDTVAETYGAELPAHDLLSTDSYTPLMEPVEESAYLGTVEIGGVTCRQLAFRADEVDWQLWVEEGDRSLPCRYTITSKWTYGAPQYTVTFTNWGLNPDLPDKDFEFVAPDGTKSVTVEEFKKSLEQAGVE